MNTEPLFEVVQSHPATGRTNLLVWDVTELEAIRILRELDNAQRARQGMVLVGDKPEAGWVYSSRRQGQPDAVAAPADEIIPTPVTDGERSKPQKNIPRTIPRVRRPTRGHG